MSPSQIPTSESRAGRETPTEPDVLAPAILRRHSRMPAALSPWARAHLLSATRPAAPKGVVNRAAAELGGQVQRAVTAAQVLPRGQAAIGSRPASFAAEVMQRTATLVGAKYALQRKATPAEGDETANLPLANPYGALSEETAEAAPPPEPNVTFAEMLARTRGQARSEPEPEPEPASKEAVASPRAPNATFAEMLALIGRKQGTAQPAAAPTARPGTPTPTAPSSVQRTGAPLRRRAHVEEMTPTSNPAPATSQPAADTSGARPKAEAHAEDEPAEEPWSPPQQAPPVVTPPSAAALRSALQPPARPALRRSRIEEVPPAQPAAEPPGVQRQAQAGLEAEWTEPEPPQREPSAAASLSQPEAAEGGVQTAVPTEAGPASVQRKPIGPAQAVIPATVAPLPAEPSSRESVSPEPGVLRAEPGPTESVKQAGVPHLPQPADLPAASVQRETPGLASTPPRPAAPEPTDTQPTAPAPSSISGPRPEPDRPQAEAPAPLERQIESRRPPPLTEQPAPLPQPPAGEEITSADPSVAPVQLAPTPATESKPIASPARVQREPAAGEAPGLAEPTETGQPAPATRPTPLPIVRRTAPVQRLPAEERVDVGLPAEIAPVSPTATTEPTPPAAGGAPLPLVERPSPVQRQPAAAAAADLARSPEIAPVAPTPTTEPTPPAAATTPLPLVEQPVPVQRQAAGEDLFDTEPPHPESVTGPVPPRVQLPLVERPGVVQRRAGVEPAAPAEAPAEATPPLERAPEGPLPPAARVPEALAPGIVQRETEAPGQAAEFVAAGLPQVSERPIAPMAPHLPQTPPSAEAPIVRRATELPLVQRATPAPAASTAEPSVETEMPPAEPGAPSLDQAVLARTAAQAHLPISATPPERPIAAAPLPVSGRPAPAVISRKEAAPPGAAPSLPFAQPPALAGEAQAASAEALAGRAQAEIEHTAEERPEEISPEALGAGTPALPAAWTPVLLQARGGATLQRRAEAQPGVGAAPLPLVSPPAVVVINRRVPGDEQAQWTAEPERSEPKPQAAPASAAAPLIIQRAPSGVSVPPMSEEPGEVEAASVEEVMEQAEVASTGSVDLDQMARDILPRIKRMLAVERERQPRRW